MPEKVKRKKKDMEKEIKHKWGANIGLHVKKSMYRKKDSEL